MLLGSQLYCLCNNLSINDCPSFVLILTAEVVCNKLEIVCQSRKAITHPVEIWFECTAKVRRIWLCLKIGVFDVCQPDNPMVTAALTIGVNEKIQQTATKGMDGHCIGKELHAQEDYNSTKCKIPLPILRLG